MRGRADGALVAALDRRDVERAIGCFAPLGAPVSVEPLAIALLRIAPGDLLRDRGAANIVLREGRLAWTVDLEQLVFGVQRAAGFGGGTDLSLLWDLAVDGPAVPWLEGVEVAADLRRPATLNQLGVAIGAALGAGDTAVSPLDLTASTRVVPVEPVSATADAGVTWFVERLGDPDVPALTEPVLLGRIG